MVTATFHGSGTCIYSFAISSGRGRRRGEEGGRREREREREGRSIPIVSSHVLIVIPTSYV